MKPGLRLGIGLLVWLSVFIPAVDGQDAVSELNAVPGEALVRYRPQTSQSRRNAIVAAHGGRVLRRMDAVHVDHVMLPSGAGTQAAAEALLGDPDVLSVEPNFVRQLVAGPNDPYYVNGNLWGLKKIQAEAAWLLTTGSEQIVVANIDTGVNYSHPDLAANMWRNPGEVAANGLDDDRNGYVDDVYGIDTANHDSNPMDDHGHGTHTAGTIGGVGNNGTGVVGINWKVRILPCKSFKASGSGSDAGAIECFNYIIALKKKGINVRVSSNSWGSLRNLTAPFPQALKDAIDAAGAAGIINVFAAGNTGYNIDSKPFDPASFTSPSIVTVAASDSADNRASFSNYGATAVDLAAPGVSIISSTVTGYGTMSGTSMATPHVAGAAALLAASNPALTVDGLKSLMMSSVDQLAQWNGIVASGGRLNLFTATLDAGGDIAPTVSLTAPVNGAKFMAPATVTLSAAASDADGTIAKVDFFANGTMIGSDTSSPYSISWTNVLPGTYNLSTVATDNRSFTGTSGPVQMAVESGEFQATRVNVAAAANGGRVSASSTYGTSYAVNQAIDGNRRAAVSKGTWADATQTAYPDWLRVDFNSSKTIDEIDVFTGQASDTIEPTTTMTSSYTIADFQVQYWTGAQWVAVPGGAVTGNRNIWRKFVFAPVTTTAIRVFVTRSQVMFSRIAEIEAYDSSVTSAPPVGNGLNVASAANGGRVSVSSTYGTSYAANQAIDGSRRAAVSTGTWADGTQSAYPDWLRVDFNGSKTIAEIDVFTGQASDTVEPTSTMTSSYTIADFQVQYWNGAQWTAVPGGIVTGNRNVWRKFVFTAVTTTAVRVLVTRSQVTFSRIAEIEAYETSTSTSPPTHTATFEVGPSKAFATPSDVPWETLTAGDTVLIHWRSTPYKDKWVISAQGTEAAPIVVRGVPGPEGQLPVIDGNGAVTRQALDYWNEARAVIKIGGSSLPADTMPRHIIIENLDVRGGRPPNTFTDHKGLLQSYIANAAAITVEKGENITIRNNRLHDNGNGLFVASGGTNVSRNILIESNSIFDNGNVGSSQEHNSYTEALGITLQYNYYGPLKAGSVGTNLKDRSAGSVVRYNWIDGGNRVLDFVDAGNATIRASALYRTTTAYGNVLIKRGGVNINQQVTHYGGDSATSANYRKGVLFFYNNTIVSLRTDRTTLFRISTNDERVDARNNIFYVTTAGTSLSLVDAGGKLDLSHNWFKPGHVSSFGTLTGVITDDGTSVESSAPGFNGESVQNFELTPTSVARNAGTTFASAFSTAHAVDKEYVKHQGNRVRPKDSVIDLGAFEVD